MGEYYVGLDIGTSAVKGVLMDEGQHIEAVCEAPLATSHPRPLWSEQDPEDWLRAADQVLAGLKSAQARSFEHVRAIGLSGQMHGAVCLDDADFPVRPAILWNDGRSGPECAEMAQSGVDIGQLAGIIAMPGFTAPKLRWMRKHEPEALDRVRTVLLPKDYVRLHLTGERTTDISDAAGTLWLDQAKREWSPQLLELSGANIDMMPSLVEGTEATGVLRPDVAGRWGLGRDTIVAGGGGDAAAGAVGISAVNDGDAFISLGTSGQYFVSKRGYSPSPQTLVHTFAHCVPRTWFQMACMLNGASCLAWLATSLGRGDIDALLGECEATYAGPSDLLFLPYLTGERTPHNDPFARSVFFGIGPGTTQRDLTQAVLEGVAFSFLEAQACLADAGTHPDAVAAIGGGTRSAFWMQMFATVLGKPVTLLAGSDKGPAFGAARLAIVAASEAAPADVCHPLPSVRRFAPDAELTVRYAERFVRFKSLYRALRDEFGTI